MPSVTASVKITYSGTECSATAAYIYLVDTSACSGSESVACHVSTDTSAASQTFCSSDRNASIADAFQGESFLGYDIFTDASCADFVATYVYLVGSCLSLGSDSSAKAALDASAGSATFQSFKDSASCASDDYTQFSITDSALADAQCVHYGGSRYYKFFTSVAIEATGTGSSGAGSATAASTGSSSAATVSTTSSESSESLGSSEASESSGSSESPTLSASASASSSSSTSSSDSAGASSSTTLTNSTLASSSSSTSALTPASSSTPSPSATVPTTPTAAGLSTATVVGIVAGAACVLALALALVVCVRRRRRKTPASSDVQVLEDATAYLSKRDSLGDATQSTSDPLRSRRLGRGLGANLWEDDVIVSWRVPRDKVHVGALISRGGSGEVYRGTYNGQDVAVKMLLPETRRSVQHVNDFLAEVKLMAALEHARIVQTVGVAWDSFSDLCVLSEFMAGGDLRTLLVRFEATGRPRGFDHDKVKIALHVAHALTYLHSLPRPVLHRDLKSKNVLLTPTLDAKLTDFGVSRERADRTMTAGVGTSLWMAPEVMVGDRYGVAADMFSFGVLLSELDTHSLPYAHATDGDGHRLPDAAVLQMVAAGSLRVEFSPDALHEVVVLGQACVSVDPAARPTAAEALGRLHRILQRG